MRYITLIIMLTCATLAQAQDNKLNRFFYHRGAITDSIGCYFSDRPNVNLIPVRKIAEDQALVKFMVPKAKVATAEARSAIERANKASHAIRTEQPNGTEIQSGPWYKVLVSEVTAPIDGIMFQFSFDPRKVRITYTTFASIQQQPGVVFQLHHLDVLEQLKEHNSAPHRLASKSTRIVIDQGHGGEDNGAIGQFNIKEKEIVYQVGMKVAQNLQHAGFTVATTRAHDIFVPLDERTTFANEWGADLFVSIHANSSPKPTTAGVETYCLKLPLIMDIQPGHQGISYDRQVWRDQQSTLLAQTVHQFALDNIHRHYPTVPDLKVKTAISQVLLGTNMPSVLIELGFVSNEQEAIRLNTASYQDLLARGICDGIANYCAKYA